MSAIAIWWLALACYLLFAGTVSGDEIIVAVVLASLSLAWAILIRRSSRLRFAPSWPSTFHLLRAICQAVPATGRTAARFAATIVGGGSPGRAVTCRFRYGATGAKERTRRAVAVLCASLAPDRFVVNVDREHDQALVHQILTGMPEPNDRWLE